MACFAYVCSGNTRLCMRFGSRPKSGPWWSTTGSCTCPREADLALLLSEQPQMQCDELGNNEVELGDLSEDEEGHLLTLSLSFRPSPLLLLLSASIAFLAAKSLLLFHSRFDVCSNQPTCLALVRLHATRTTFFECYMLSTWRVYEFLDLRDTKNSDYNFSGHTVPIQSTHC
jgi:hypothetical protein